MAKNKTKNLGVWIIVGLLCVAMLGFGGAGLSGNVRSVGTVGDLNLSTDAYYGELNTLIRIQSLREQRPVSFPEAEATGLTLRALQAVVSTRALDNEAAQLGLSVGNSAINQTVLSNPAFRGTDGAFDADRYAEALAQSGQSVRQYETSLREEATRGLLQSAIFAGVPDPLTYGEIAARYNRQGRTFTWATLGSDDIEVEIAAPSDEDLQAFYDENIADYTSLETREIEYVRLTPDMIQDQVMVDEDALRAEYEARIDDFVQPERRLIERLIFADVAAAQAALASIDAGEQTFPQIVEAAGFTLEGVDGGAVSEEEMGAAGPAIFALDTGGVTGPFDTEFGPALYRMNAVLAARNITFEQAEADLREDEAAQAAIRLIEDQIDPISNLLAGGAALLDVAADTDMEFDTLDWTVLVSDDIAAYAEFRDAAARQEVGDFAELGELSDGGLFALEVVNVRAPAPIALEDIRAEVLADWQAAQTANAVIEAAQAKRAQLMEGVQSFEFIDLDGTQETDMRRDGVLTGTPPTFLREVFEMAVGDVRVLENGSDAVIVRLDAISAADPETDAFKAELDAFALQGAEGIAQDIYEAYAREVQVRTDVSINDAAINAVHSTFR